MSNYSRRTNSGPRKFDDSSKTGSQQDLLALLRKIDGSSYGAYKRAIGVWDFGGFKVYLDRVQSDPYAPPSSLRITADPSKMGLPPETLTTPDQRVATGDFLIRAFGDAIRRHDGRPALSIVRTTQEILDRSAAVVTPERVELRSFLPEGEPSRDAKPPPFSRTSCPTRSARPSTSGPRKLATTWMTCSATSIPMRTTLH